MASSAIDITEHPLLSPKAQALGQDQVDAFEGQRVVAESLLGLTGRTYNSLELEAATLAVVFQVNYQIHAGIDPFVVISAGNIRTGESTTYRGYRQFPLLHPIAAKLVENLNKADELNLQSLRSG